MARGRGRCLYDGRGGGGSIYARALYIIYINGRRLQYTRAHARDGERRKPGGSAVFLHPAGAPVLFAVRIAESPAPSPRPDSLRRGRACVFCIGEKKKAGENLLGVTSFAAFQQLQK